MSDNFDLTYKLLFRKYYANLLFYATRIVGDEEAEGRSTRCICRIVAAGKIR